MTMPIGAAEEPTVEYEMPDAVPVHVVSSGAKSSKRIGTEFGRWRTYFFTTGSAPQRIAPRSMRRHRLLIKVNALSTSVTSTAGGVAQPSIVKPANPGANTFTYTLVGPAQLTGLTFTYTTDAVVGNRFVQFQVKDPSGTILYTGQNNAAVAASSNVTVNSQIGGPNNGGTSGPVFATMPSQLFLATGSTITLLAGSGGDVGDTVTNITLDFSPTQLSTTNDGVFVMDRDTASNAGPLATGFSVPLFQGGGLLQVNDNERWECQQELWAAPQAGNVGTVVMTVCDEQYASSES